jgi:hypothetical protein
LVEDHSVSRWLAALYWLCFIMLQAQPHEKLSRPVTGSLPTPEQQTICPIAACLAISSLDPALNRQNKSQEQGKRDELPSY